MPNNVALKLLILALCVALMGLYIVRDKLHAGPSGVPVAQLQYRSEEGVGFLYPSTYKLASTNEQVGSLAWDSTDFVSGSDKISLSIFSDAEGLALKDFVTTQRQSNYALSEEGTLTPGTIGGEPSLAYQYRLLNNSPYYSDAVAIVHNHRIFIFSDTWTQTVDPVRQDFNKLLGSVQF